MQPAPRFTWFALLCLLLVLAGAGGARAWYLMECAGQGWSEPAMQVQGDAPRPTFAEGAKFRSREKPTELDNLVFNVADSNWFGGMAPFADKEETTAHVAPGYAWMCGFIASVRTDDEQADWTIRWLQCILGSLTVGCYFLAARRAFHSTFIAFLAGLLTAGYPFWIINTAELNDGVLASFLLGASLMFGTRASQTGGPLSGLLFGLALAGLCMVRAALLPFALIALIWFLWRCRRFSLGWLAGILMLVAFVNGLAPWVVRNYQAFERPIPIANSTYLHLWMGNHPHATGAALEDADTRASLPPERVKELLSEPNQAKRFDKLAHEVWEEASTHPTATIARRIQAALVFFLGDRWFKQKQFAILRDESSGVAEMPDWLRVRVENILHATLLALLLLAVLGWRWSHAWYTYARLGTIAAVWIPVPYILSHAEALSGPRLPLDGILLCYAAYALASLIPGVARAPARPPKPPKEK